ncbi:DNA-binding transcriptional regulator Fis [Aliikangiella sp. G2MR2-5]|uniref:DNA-binding transcriptional regulator Fis n=1 Tax=Aliikangiella sp. G2MR2-5 TaxID=2788943 RepID=UPI001FED688B|nr:DNA-binding transcriptional regulator Fis [Aliikangiella sp. G2MR2-5]
MNLDSMEIMEQKETGSFEITSQQTTLRESVEQAMKAYFAQLEDEKPTDIYNMVLAEVEAPLMECVMAYTQGNQTKASQVLGLNRGTLRKKLKMYGLN